MSFRKKLSDFLEKHGVQAEIIDTGEDTDSVAASSQILGLSRKKIVKSIVFQSDVGLVLALARGDQRVSEDKLAELIDAQNIQLANADQVRKTTGYPVGGVPPVGHDCEQDIIYVIDREILKCDKVYAGGGDSKAQLNIKVADIIQLVDPKLADISE